jgi:butyrate kinase
VKQAPVVLAINPGSTSTKVAVFTGEALIWDRTVRHGDEIRGLGLWEQFPARLRSVETELERAGAVRREELSIAVARGGLMRPVAGGVYAINQEMLDDLRTGVQGEHASNLGAAMAWEVARPLGIPAYVVDPVSVDEFGPLARLSGLPELPRRSLLHALNMKAAARRAAGELGKLPGDTRLVICHLGGGISVAPYDRGLLVDANNANEEGPFGPERAGGLPAGSLVALCFSGQYAGAAELRRRLVGGGGMTAYLGTADGEEAMRRVAAGDERATLVMRAMAYQVAKEIGAMAAVLCGKVDAIVITGGLARAAAFREWIEERVRFIAPVLVYPGEDEMRALAEGALRVWRGEEEVRTYPN